MANEKKPKPTVVGGNEPVGGGDPFDLANIAVAEITAEDLGVGKPILMVPVEKPNKQDFFRVHPGEDYRAEVRLIVLEAERERYLVTRAVWPAIPGETKLVRLATYLTRTGAIGLWPVALPDDLLGKKDVNWNVSARKAAELAESTWVRLQANMSLGRYDVLTSDKIAEPIWPDITFHEILKIAFGDGKLIDRLDHPVVTQLAGR